MKFQANIPFKLTKLFYEKLGEQPKNKRVLVIRDLFTAMHASIDNAVTFVTDDEEACELFNKNVVSNDEFGNNDTAIFVDTEINKTAWKDFINEIASMPKFDVAIMTLGHDNLHLKFLEKVIPIAYKVVNISPDTWCAKHNRWKNIFQNYKNSAVGKPIEYEHFEHREANDLFCLGNQIESLGIMVYDENNDNKIDLTKFGFSEKEFSLYNKIMSDKKGKLIWRKNGINIIEPKNSTKKFIQPVNIWHGGDTCYEAAIGESRNHKKGKIQLQAEFDTKNELNNFQNSFKTKFMEWYYKFIVIPSVCKLHISMFVMSDYSKPWYDKRFCEYFNITGYISDTEAAPNSEWEIILNTMKE
jgi:hypothetical protein